MDFLVRCRSTTKETRYRVCRRLLLDPPKPSGVTKQNQFFYLPNNSVVGHPSSNLAICLENQHKLSSGSHRATPGRCNTNPPNQRNPIQVGLAYLFSPEPLGLTTFLRLVNIRGGSKRREIRDPPPKKNLRNFTTVFTES